MGWGAIILAIIQIIGPYVAAWIKQLIERWLNKAALRMGAEPKVAGDVGALFDEAIAGLPRLAFVRRGALRTCKRIAASRAEAIMSGATIPPLSAEETAELRDAAGAVEDELVGV